MRETPRAFAKRTGLAYDPPPSAGRALRRGESCPTLFRYPGPGALAALLQGTRTRLAPAGASGVWLAEDVIAVCPTAARRFGAVGVLEPLRLQPRRIRPGEYLGLDLEMEEGAELIWVPPARLRHPPAWDVIATPEEAREALGRAYREGRSRTLDALTAYLEEISALAAAGAPPPDRPWHDVAAARRRRLLDQHGIRPRWTPR